jgi:osmotically-inducible protein OsmY
MNEGRRIMIPTDENIKKDVIDRLYWDSRVNAGDITVKVNGGDVTLEGFVSSYYALACAYDNAICVPGVTRVNNRIAVRSPVTESAPTDERIETQITGTFATDPDIHTDDIRVHVDQGVVTLEGFVDSFWKKEYAEYLVSRRWGVTGIKNELAVVLTSEVGDQEIANQVMSALGRIAIIDAEKVDVVVEEGTVTMTGEVSSPLARRVANQAALYTAGVKGINDNLRVSSS